MSFFERWRLWSCLMFLGEKPMEQTPQCLAGLDVSCDVRFRGKKKSEVDRFGIQMPKAETQFCNFSSGKETNIWRFKHHFGLHFTMNSATKTWYDDIIDLNRYIQAYKTIDFFDRSQALVFRTYGTVSSRQLFFSHTLGWGRFSSILRQVPPLLCVYCRDMIIVFELWWITFL